MYSHMLFCMLNQLWKLVSKWFSDIQHYPNFNLRTKLILMEEVMSYTYQEDQCSITNNMENLTFQHTIIGIPKFENIICILLSPITTIYISLWRELLDLIAWRGSQQQYYYNCLQLVKPYGGSYERIQRYLSSNTRTSIHYMLRHSSQPTFSLP